MKEVEYLGFHVTTERKLPIGKKLMRFFRSTDPETFGTFDGLIAPNIGPVDSAHIDKTAVPMDTDRAASIRGCKTNGGTKEFDKTFDLYTDASARQLGGVIMQEGRPLAFWSKKCNESQEHYTMNKKELLGVVEMLREFRSILWGRKIRIFPEHKNSVQATFNNEQTLRWSLEIEEYGPEIVYIKGHDNIVADALLRLPLKPDEIAAARESQANVRILLPLQMVSKVMNTYHERLMHPGEQIMLESLKEVMTWPGMTEAVCQWVRNCATCARSKVSGQKYRKIRKKTIEVCPWAEIAVDTLDPRGKHGWRAMTIIDTSTQLVGIISMTDGTSAEAARIVDQAWFNRYPRPERCIYDRGPEFRCEFPELLESYGVEYIGNTAKICKLME
ncbi:Pol Polyprotein [Phytophthora megakarya]|uniref:Pol Polyprotein n=1 Tax=Phytophthora megakarya TaxID=4795 RepID=A0A225WEU0_9STRA|nr:Pol Polyprotein [Phytophthora megakarya]